MSEHDQRDLRAELKALRAAVEDRTDAVDSTLGAVQTLSRSLEELVSRQARRERTLTLNSFVAYCLFTVLLGGGFALLYKSRSGDLVDARAAVMAERDAARQRARELSDDLSSRARAAERAAAFYEHLQAEQYEQVISTEAELRDLRLSTAEEMMVRDGVQRARSALAERGYKDGLAAFRRGAFEPAIAAFRRALVYAEAGPTAAQMRHYLGVALTRQGSHEEAIEQLELALEAGVEQHGVEVSRFHLALTHEAAGHRMEALEELGRFVGDHPGHRMAPIARRKMVALRSQRPMPGPAGSPAAKPVAGAGKPRSAARRPVAGAGKPEPAGKPPAAGAGKPEPAAAPAAATPDE